MSYAVLQISRGELHLLIREDDDLKCWERRTFLPPERMLLESNTIQEVLDLIEEMIELARLQGVPVWEIYACMDIGMSTVLNINAILQRSKTELALPIHPLKPDEEALWGWMGKTLGMSLKPGPTAWIDISHNAIFCVLGESAQILQVERIQWSLLERGVHYWGKSPNRFKSTDILSIKSDIESRLRNLQWTVRPHNLIITGTPVVEFQQLLSVGDQVPQSFSRATLRQWIDHLSQTHRKQRQQLMGKESKWVDGIFTTTLLLMELCNRSFKDSFQISEGELALGILASVPTTHQP